MNIVACFLFVVLAAVALVHAYWGAGGRWPAKDDRSLAETVVGTTKFPSPAACYGVACALMVVAVMPLFVAQLLHTPWPFDLTLAGGGIFAATFMVRGLAGYHTAWRRTHSREPFATYDQQFYSPLCLALGSAYLFLLLSAVRS